MRPLILDSFAPRLPLRQAQFCSRPRRLSHPRLIFPKGRRFGCVWKWTCVPVGTKPVSRSSSPWIKTSTGRAVRLLLEKGDLARGHVIESAGHGAFGRAGKLTFTCDYAQADDGTRIPLNLTVVPKAGANDGGESVGEVAASVSTGAHGYYPSPAPDGSPGEFYQQAGVTAGVRADIGRVIGGGSDVTAKRGQKYDATIAANTLLAVAPSPAVPTAQLFTLKDKTQVTGALTSFDGQNYTVETPTGRRSLRAADVQSIQALSSVPKP